jgi:predicted MPP superfamily phosphohydrolase
MKLRYLSDLHLEFLTPDETQTLITKIQPSMDEICILAGDIGNPYQPNYDTFMEFISKGFKKAFVISGNHEYYNKTKTIQQTIDYQKEYFTRFDNISFLDNSYEIYNQYCFIGTTLWSKITNPKYKINDVYNIPQFNHIEYNKLNAASIEFLEDAINDNCIIITHHLPSDSLTHPKYKNDLLLLPYNQWFSCDMDTFIENNKSKIKCWIYGHTHTPSNKMIHDIPFVCNPIGYPDENWNVDFQQTIIIDR